MKRFFTFFAALAVTMVAFAQMHGPMRFVGDATFSAMGASKEQKKDTLVVEMGNKSAGTSDKITIPDMVYSPNMVIKSFTVDGLAYAMVGQYPNMYFEWSTDNFSTTTIGTDGQEKQVSGKLNAQYYHTSGKFAVTVEFTYGAAPHAMTYTCESAFYLKSTSMALTVNVLSTDYTPAANVEYQTRRYMDGDVEKLDVVIPAYSLAGTPMGDLEVGGYTVCGLTYDETLGGYFKDYSQDGLTVHLKTYPTKGQGLDGDYALAAEGTTLFVQYKGNNVVYVENNFIPGSMPFPIFATSGEKQTTDVKAVEAEETQPAVKSYKRVENGKLLIIKADKKYNSAGQQL